VLPGLGIDPTPWTQLAGATPTLPARRGRNAGADLLLEEDGYLGLYAGPDADEVIWKKNAKRVERLAGLLPQLYRALDRVERTVGPGAVLERVQVAREGRKSLVALDGERFDVTDVYGADKVFGLLREADGDFVPGKVVGAAIELKQFKPKEFKAKLARTNRRLAALVDPVRSGGTRLVLPLPPH
jgi:hypothetical protein